MLHRLRLELDALRQRQRVGVVDRVGLPAHVGLPRVGARFASAAGFLLAAEGAADFGAAGADVDVGDAAVASRLRPGMFGFAQVGGEDRTTTGPAARRSGWRWPRRASVVAASRRGSGAKVSSARTVVGLGRHDERRQRHEVARAPVGQTRSPPVTTAAGGLGLLERAPHALARPSRSMSGPIRLAGSGGSPIGPRPA